MDSVAHENRMRNNRNMRIQERINKRVNDRKNQKLYIKQQREDIQNTKNLEYINVRDYTRSIIVDGVECFSSTPNIVRNPTNPEQYIVNIRWVSYKINEDGVMFEHRLAPVSLSRFLVDNSFKQITKEVFLREQDNDTYGLEDIRLFCFQNRLYYSGCFYKRSVTNPDSTMECGQYEFQESQYTINKHIIHSLRNHTEIVLCKNEKNWSYVEYRGELCMVYKWYPLQIGKVDFESGIFHIMEEKLVPELFKNVRGSTPGYRWKNELWFVVHTTKIYDGEKPMRNYKHMFVVFDTDMNLLRYSEYFSFEKYVIEFCTGLIIEEDRTIVSYSTLDRTSRISILNNTYIKHNLLWEHRNIYSLQDIRVYIFNWKKVSKNTMQLYEKIKPIVKNTCIINCDETLILNNDIQHIQLDDSHYYGSQYNNAIKHIDNNSIMCVIVGDNVSDNNFDVIFHNAIRTFNIYNVGVFSPNDKRATGHTEKLTHIEGTLYTVANTDSGFWFINPRIVAKLKNIDYTICKYGWGIDTITMKEAKKQGLYIIRDYSIETDQLDHSTGYAQSDAVYGMNKLEEIYNTL